MNEHSPVISGSYSYDVPENTAISYSVTTVTATDADDGSTGDGIAQHLPNYNNIMTVSI